MSLRLRSLTARVLLLATMWSAVALVVIAVVISTLYRQGTERGFQELLRAQLYNVINSVSIGPDGKIAGRPELGDLRFSQPQTGWYWMVEPLGDFKTAPLTSASLGTTKLAMPPIADVPFDDNYERFYVEPDGQGNLVQVAETEVVLDQDGRAARFRVSGNRAIVESDIQAFSNRLYLALGGFGIGSLIVNAFAILIGLKPLDQARAALEKIRRGEAERPADGFPPRDPAAGLRGQRADRQQPPHRRAGAHAGGQSRAFPENPDCRAAERIARAGTHPWRSREGSGGSHAGAGAILSQTAPASQPSATRCWRVAKRMWCWSGAAARDAPAEPGSHLRPLRRARRPCARHGAAGCGRTVGNLLDNAARFAKSRVSVAVSQVAEGPQTEGTTRRTWIEVLVDDDGPGLEPHEIREAMKRGRRLDESKPGTGLGLSIVTEITSEYQGEVLLTRSPSGGLRARLLLPGMALAALSAASGPACLFFIGCNP